MKTAVRFDVQNPVWERLGHKVQGNLTSKEMMIAGGLDFQIEKKPVFNKVVRGGIESFETIPNKFSTVRLDTQESLGIVGNNYQILQNRNAFSFMDSLVGIKKAAYDSSGYFGLGERIWALLRLDGVVRIGGDDVINKFLLLSNSHNGTKSVEVCITAIRPICMNSLNLAIKTAANAGQAFKIRHSGLMTDKVEQARQTLGIINHEFESFEIAANAMTKIKINTKKLDEFLDSVGFDPDAEKGKAKGSLDEVKLAFEQGPGAKLSSSKGTLYGALNAVTYYADHVRSSRLTDSFKSIEEARLYSAWMGSADVLKRKAYDAALKLMA